jgi:3-deoxy-manno-octulosonate cytidylyltransferase (CMP-KDO synthetase)
LNILAIIPARMAATRFPNKPLALINKLPMIGHVYNRVKMSKNISEVYVATCDTEIFDYIVSIGGKCIMTKNSHERATDRAGEAYLKLVKKNNNFEGIIMIQGDEPMLNPLLLDEMIFFHRSQKKPFVTNLISKIEDKSEFGNNNIVKLVKDKKDRILYMSRSKIPSDVSYKGEIPMWKQLGLILFSTKALLTYINLTPTILEVIESVDMNRLLENGFNISTYPTDEITHAVDIEEDLKIVEKLILTDPIYKRYSK